MDIRILHMKEGARVARGVTASAVRLSCYCDEKGRFLCL